MENKIVIEIYRKKEPEDFTKLLADPEAKPDIGSGAALVAANACALGLRAANIAAKSHPANERLDYIIRNLEKLRAYMVYLIDEDVKCRMPLRRAMKEGGDQEIEASRHPACCINDEIINQMCNVLELLSELADMECGEAGMYIASAVHMGMAAIKSSRLFVVDMANHSSDETFAFVTRRENEMTLEKYSALAGAILAKTEGRI